MKEFIKQLFCRHSCISWIRDVQPEEGKDAKIKSFYRCADCQKILSSSEPDNYKRI